MKDLNENIIKLTGSASVIQPLKVDKEYNLFLTGEVYSKEKRSRQDGTYDNIFKIKLLTGEVMNEKGESQKFKDKQRWSVKLRQAIFSMGHDYDEAMSKILQNLDNIL